jgi:hypothetical protein
MSYDIEFGRYSQSRIGCVEETGHREFDITLATTRCTTMTHLLPDFLPDDPSHLISVQLYDRVLDLDLLSESALGVAYEYGIRRARRFPITDTGQPKSTDESETHGDGQTELSSQPLLRSTISIRGVITHLAGIEFHLEQKPRTSCLIV